MKEERMALSKKVARDVGEEKRRAAMKGGASPEKADEYARQVRQHAAAERAAEKGRN